MRQGVKFLLAIGVWLVVHQVDVLAQFTVQHQAPTVISNGEDTSFEFLVAGINQQQVQEAILFYRLDGDISFSQKEAILRNGIFTVTHKVENNSASALEYYFLLRLTNGQEISFPDADFTENPIRVPIVGTVATEEPEYEQLTGVDFNILAPEAGSAFTEDDFVVAIALFYDQAGIEPGKFHLFIDGQDVTADADTSSHFISYSPEKIRTGNHSIALDYITDSGERLRLTGWEFSIIDPSKAQYAGFGERRVPIGSLELTARNQDVGGDINDALTGRLRLSGSQGYFNYSVNGFLTSQESDRLQPQNRFGVNMNYGKWWRFNAGHIFPRISNLSLAGRRVFGINSSIHLLNEGFNVQFLYGEINRNVTNIYGSLTRQEVLANDGSVVDTTYSLGFADEGRGTFTREIIGGRVAFGNPRKFQFGIHALKVEDDTTSLDRITDFNTLQTFRRDLSTGLSPADITKLTNQPELLAVSGNPTPNGNLVAGADLKMTADKRRIQLEAEVSAGMLNSDITGGALTVERADELGFDIDEDDADLLDRISRYIIINENLRNLPLRITDDDDTEFFFPTAILAGNGLTSLNYGANNLRVQYRWIGPDYNSLANNTVRRDVAGITITDRIRMFRNRIFLTLGYETLDDNVVGNLDATTNTQTLRTNLSWYPINRLLPRVSLGIRSRSRDNDVVRFNPNVGNARLNAAVQNFVIVAGDTLGAPTARSNSTFNFNGSITQQFELFDMQHDASLNLNTLQTTDDVFEFGDTKSTSVSVNVNSRFAIMPLSTNFGFTVNNTETISGLNKFEIFGFFVGGTYFMMDGKLRLTGRLASTSNKTTTLPLRINDNNTDTAIDDFFEPDNPLTERETDFSTFVLRTGVQYDINQYHALLFDANFTNVSGDNISNDRIVQLRYIFKF